MGQRSIRICINNWSESLKWMRFSWKLSDKMVIRRDVWLKSSWRLEGELLIFGRQDDIKNRNCSPGRWWRNHTNWFACYWIGGKALPWLTLTHIYMEMYEFSAVGFYGCGVFISGVKSGIIGTKKYTQFVSKANGWVWFVPSVTIQSLLKSTVHMTHFVNIIIIEIRVLK